MKMVPHPKKAAAGKKANSTTNATLSTAGGVPATAADAAAAAALPKATADHTHPPVMSQVEVLNSSNFLKAIAQYADVLTALGIDGAQFAADAQEVGDAGERSLRFFESAYRCMEDFQTKHKALSGNITILSTALRRLDPSSPLRTAFAPFLQARDASRGVAATKRTRQQKARTAKGQSANASNGSTGTTPAKP